MSEVCETEKDDPLVNNDIENPELERKKKLICLLSIWIVTIIFLL